MKIVNLAVRMACLLLAGLLLTPVPCLASQTPAPPPTRVRPKMDGFDISKKAGGSANQIGGASRDIGSPQLYAPKDGKAYSLTPVFYWGTADGAQKVTFRLSSPNGEPLYEATTSDTHLAYPADAPALSPGVTYHWTIIPENDMLGGSPVPAQITIVGGAERSAIEQDLPSAADHAAVFVDHRVWYDAVASYTAVLDQTPGNQAARKGRAAVYDQLPVTQPLADADMQMVH